MTGTARPVAPGSSCPITHRGNHSKRYSRRKATAKRGPENLTHAAEIGWSAACPEFLPDFLERAAAQTSHDDSKWILSQISTRTPEWQIMVEPSMLTGNAPPSKGSSR